MAPRRSLLAAPLLLLCGLGVLVFEGVQARRGEGAPEAPGTPDGLFGAVEGTGKSFEFVVLGDSTGSGVGAGTQDDGYPRRCARHLATRLKRPVQLTSYAVSGARVADVRHDQLVRLGNARPDLVLVVIGANDVVAGSNPLRARDDLGAVLDALSHTGATVVVSGVPEMGTIRRVAQPLRALLGLIGHYYDRIWRQETTRRCLHRVDLAAATGAAFASDASLFSADGFHPGPTGYELWAQTFNRALDGVYS
ncbi:MAG: SGNH/GDSL hydrolase family protein [Candidatus Dormibacteria bacterium]